MFSEPDVLDKFIDVGGDVAYLQEAASDVYTARGWIFGFGFCFSTVSIMKYTVPSAYYLNSSGNFIHIGTHFLARAFPPNSKMNPLSKIDQI